MESKIDLNWVGDKIPADIKIEWPPSDTFTFGGNEYFDSAHNFVEFCKIYFKVQHPVKGIIPFEPYEYQKDLVRAIEGNRYVIGTKFRVGGFTTTLALYSLWKCMSSAGQHIGIVVKSDYEARTIGQMVNGIIDRMPSKVGIGKRYDHEVHFDNGSHIWFHEPIATCGRAMTHLIIDEAAFIKDIDKHWTAMYPVISTGGKAIVLSTVNKGNGWFYDKYMDAKNGKNKFSIYNCHHWQHPEYSQSSWQDEMKLVMGSEGYQREIEQRFVVSKSGYDFRLYDATVMGVFRDLVEKPLGKNKQIVAIYGTDEKADTCMFGINELRKDGSVVHRAKLPLMNLYCVNYAFDSGLKVNYRLNIRAIYQQDMNEIINSILDRFKLHFSRPSRDIGVGELLVDSIDTNLDAPDCGELRVLKYDCGELRVLKYGMNLRLIVR